MPQRDTLPMSEALWQMGPRELRRAYARGDISPLDAVETLAARIDALDLDLGAFTTRIFEQARARARHCAEELARGGGVPPLHGIPVAVKELFDVEDEETTYGSSLLAGRVPERNAEAVARLVGAGAIVVGLTRSHEFAWGITTQSERLGGTRNPWDLTRVPGGSSGGAAAAVAAGLAPLALGSDTGGSIRIPAGFCGIAGFKPTHGAIPLEGVCPLAPSLDHAGPLARRAGDLVDAYCVLAGREPAPVPAAPCARIGICPDLHVVPLAADRRRAFEDLVSALEGAGSAIVKLRLQGADQIYETFSVIQLYEAYLVHTRTLGLYPARAAEYSESVLKRLELAARVTRPEYERACEERMKVRARFAALFERCDVLLTPLSAVTPSLVTRPNSVEHEGRRIPFRDLVMHYTVPQNVAGLPACAVPAGRDDTGLPIGVQVSAPYGQDLRCLAAAGWIEEIAEVPGWPPLAFEAT